MTRGELRTRDLQRLDAILPAMRDVVLRVLEAMDALGYPMVITAGLRTTAEQQALYAKGRTTAGAVVTNADGVIKKSNHQAKADGFGYAVDLAFLIDGPNKDGELDTPTWDDAHPWQVFGSIAEFIGGNKIVWGGRWQTLRDLPHLEWRG